MSVRRVATGPPVGGAAGVGSVLPPLQNLRAVPTGVINNDDALNFSKTNFVLNFGFGSMSTHEEVFDNLKRRSSNTPKDTDLYVWLKVSGPSNVTTRNKIVRAISNNLESLMRVSDLDTLDDVVNTQFDSMYEKSCSGVYETTRAYYTYSNKQVYAMDKMVEKDLNDLVKRVMKFNDNAQTVEIGGNTYTYNEKNNVNDVVTRITMEDDKKRFPSEVTYEFSA